MFLFRHFEEEQRSAIAKKVVKTRYEAGSGNGEIYGCANKKHLNKEDLVDYLEFPLELESSSDEDISSKNLVRFWTCWGSFSERTAY